MLKNNSEATKPAMSSLTIIKPSTNDLDNISPIPNSVNDLNNLNEIKVKYINNVVNPNMFIPETPIKTDCFNIQLGNLYNEKKKQCYTVLTYLVF